MNGTVPEIPRETYDFTKEILKISTDANLRHALSTWRTHLLRRSFERLASDIDPESGLNSAMVRLHHHFAAELPITEIGTILPSDENATYWMEEHVRSALRPLFAIREKITTSGYSDQAKFELGESVRECLAEASAIPLSQYGAVAEQGLRDHCPGNSLTKRNDDGGFDFSEIIDRITM